MDDARERTERTAAVPVPDPAVEMVLVMQILSEANAIVAAVSGALAPRLDGVQRQMVLMAEQVGCGTTAA